MLERQNPLTVKEYLDKLGVEYEYFEHSAVETMEDCKEVAKTTKADFCKNLFLQNRQGTEYFLLLIDQDKKFRTAEVSKLIGRARLSFGSKERLYEYLGVAPGAITPLGLIFDKEQKVTVLIDKALIKMDKLSVHPLVNDATVTLRTADVTETLMKATGHTPIFIEIK